MNHRTDEQEAKILPAGLVLSGRQETGQSQTSAKGSALKFLKIKPMT